MAAGAATPAPEELGDKGRTLHGLPRAFQRGLLIAIPAVGVPFILGLHTYLGLRVFREQFIGLLLTLILLSVFLSIRPTPGASAGRVPWFDWLLMLASLPVGLYLATFYPELVRRQGYITPERLVVAGLAIVLVLEALRRVVGWMLLGLVLLFIFYGRYTHLFPGFLGARGTPWDQLINYLYLDTNSMLDMVGLAATIGLAFILYGQVLFVFGGGKFLTDLAFALMGQFRGGAAKTSIISSSLIGTITGGPVTNVILDGVVTIPMMKSSGYRPHVAAAIEAVASSGGQIMPPVMGIAAFLIAEFLNISYAEVALAAVIPAILYYLALFVQVDLEAGKQGLRGLPRAVLPSLREVVRRGWIFLLAIAVLLYTLFWIGLPAATAATVSALVSLALMPLLRENRREFGRKVLEALEGTGKIVLDIGVILAAAGFIVGVMALSGLAFNLSLGLVQTAGGRLWLLLLLAALVSVILGMGMPSVAAYVMVVILVAPALVEMGVLPLAAHLFVFYFSILSNLTPPVAVAAYAAAALARADPIQTGVTATRLGLLAYIVPFLFVYSPSLLGRGAVWEVALASLAASLGTFLLGIALVGYLYRETHWLKRGVLTLGSLGLFLLAPLGITQASPWGWLSGVAGIALAVPVLVQERQKGRRLSLSVGPS